MTTLKIATFNVNGISSRLPTCSMAGEASARHRLPAGAQGARRALSRSPRMRDAGYGAIWHGQRSWNGVAILARGAKPIETPARAAGRPGRRRRAATSRRRWTASSSAASTCPTATRSRGRSSTTSWRGSSGSDRSTPRRCYGSGHPVVLAGDYNVVPTDFDIYNPRSWLKDALLQPETPRALRSACSRRAGSMRCARCIRTNASTRSGTTSASTGSATPGCASTTCCSAPSWRRDCSTPASTLGRGRP